MKLATLIFCMIAVLNASKTVAQITVFLDYTGFQTQLNNATSNASVANFNSNEIATIQANILNSLNFVFSSYSVTFTQSNPGGNFETLQFGVVGGGYGLADRIDFGNVNKNDVGRIFTANFSDFLESSDSRAQQIFEIGQSLAGTAAHELGHNLGLEHRDPYGMSILPGSNFTGGTFTAGIHNQHIMGTGITGLNESEREVQRTLSDLSHVKLEFADGVNPNAMSFTAEQAGAHGSVASAQDVVLNDLIIGASGYDKAAAVDGTISVGGQDDFYSVHLNAGERLTVQVISDVISGINDIDSTLTLFDMNGITTLVQNDDTSVDGDSMNPGDFTYSNDASIYNFLASSSGTYFIQVSANSSSDIGNYFLLLAATTVVPEPGSALIIALAFAVTISHRRSRRWIENT